MKRIVLVDGNSIVNRAFYALPPLSNGEGIYTNGIYGFMTMTLKMMEEFSPDYFVVAFDVKGKTFRHDVYQEYKGTRKGMPEELRMQMPLLKELLDDLGISRIELSGFEADDLIGTLSREGKEAGYEVVIVSGDKDNLQLVDDQVKVAITKKGISEMKVYSPEDVLEELGVNPDRVIDLKGLAGDSSDNIPGVKGVGPKTAVKLLNEFDTVEGIIENLEKISAKRARELVTEHQELAVLSKKLATINREVPLSYSWEEFLNKPFTTDKALPLLTRLQMGNLLSQLGHEGEAPARNEDFETGNSNEMTSDFWSAVKDDLYLFTLMYQDQLVLFASRGEGVYYTKDEALILEGKKVLENRAISKKGFGLKDTLHHLSKKGIRLAGVAHDTMIAHYLLYPDRNSMDVQKVAAHLVQEQITSIEEFSNKEKKAFSEIEEDLLTYGEFVMILIAQTEEALKEELERDDLLALYEEVEIPLIEVLASMELAGFRVDKEALDELDKEVSKKIEHLEASIHSHAGESFNINSPKQLSQILFEKLGLPVIKKTKTGYSTNHDVLMKLQGKHEIIDEIVDYRAVTKLKSTYIDGLRNVIDEDGKIHTSFQQTVAVTGRLSSVEPNLQNIPIRLEEGRKIRKIFVPSEGRVLVDADYSQIELRILAHFSEDDQLMRAYTEDIDIHALTASQVFDIPLDEVTSFDRGEAKGVNFGIVYGISDYGLSENLGISRKKAADYIETYFEKYPKVKKYLDQLISDCKDKGYVTTLMGRRRDIPDINASNYNRRSFAERTAMNTPIQGSAADVIKKAMIDVYKALQDKGLQSTLILQVHDELMIDAVPEELDEVKTLLKERMEKVVDLKVPLAVDMKTGKSWYETK